MTVWGEGRPEETDGDEFNRVQIELGCDATDIWLVFNRKTSAVQMTHDECRVLMEQMGAALDSQELPQPEADAKAFKEDSENLFVEDGNGGS